MVKQPAFIQPDGISKTLLKEDMYAGMENLCFSSVFSYKNSRGFALRWRRKSLIIVLLLVCGDVETLVRRRSLESNLSSFCLVKENLYVRSIVEGSGSMPPQENVEIYNPWKVLYSILRDRILQNSERCEVCGRHDFLHYIPTIVLNNT